MIFHDFRGNSLFEYIFQLAKKKTAGTKYKNEDIPVDSESA